MNQLAKMQEALQVNNSRRIFLEELCRSALAYIATCPCGYDIAPEQWDAWQVYQEALANATRAGVLPFPSEKSSP